MSTPEKALATQLANIEKRTGKSLEQLTAIIKKSGLTKHGEIRDMLKSELGMGHGDANTLTHVVQQSAGAAPGAQDGSAAGGNVLDEIYTGPKAALRPIHEALMAEIGTFGEFEIAPKKGYVSLRRKKQFAMIGPTTNTRVDLGLNAKGMAAHDRLLVMPPNGMCQYQVRLTSAGEVDKTVIDWVRKAYDAAG